MLTESIIDKIKSEHRSSLKNDIPILLCTFECIIFYHLIEIFDKGMYTNININEIYNIINIYSKSFNKLSKEVKDQHNNCLCKKCFNNMINLNEINTKIDSLEKYICIHYEEIEKIKNIFNLCYCKYPNIDWLINHSVIFDGKTKEYKINNRFDMIGYDNENVLIAYIKPQFNSLNYNQILLDSICDTYFVMNLKIPDTETELNSVYEKIKEEKIKDDYKRFNNKIITIVIFTTSLEEPYYIKWDMTTSILDYCKKFIKDKLIDNFINESNYIYNFYKYWREFCPQEIKKSSMDFIDFIRCKYENFHSFPSYIDNFFISIKNKIEECKKPSERKKVLEKYDNKDTFNTELNNKIIYSINRFLGIDEDEDEDEDEEEC